MRWLLVFLCACGSTLESPNDASVDGASDARKDAAALVDGELAVDSGIDAQVTGTCPSTMPMWGTPCTSSGTAGLLCEYDTTYFPLCVLACDADGNWRIVNGANECPPWDAGAPTCPASIPPKGTSCKSSGECNYQEGSCLCLSTCGGPPMDPVPPSWTCNTNPPNCPVPRPRFGEPCSTPEKQCSYRLCCGGSDMICHNGIWQGTVTELGCP